MSNAFKKYSVLSIIFVLIGVFLNVSFGATADCEIGGNVYPWCQAVQNAEGEKGVSALIGEFYKIALAFVGATAFGVMVYGGILYTVSAGNSSKQQDAMAWIAGAVWGIALLLGAYLLLNTINPELTKLTPFKIDEIKITPKNHNEELASKYNLVCCGFGSKDGGGHNDYQWQEKICSLGFSSVAASSCNNEPLIIIKKNVWACCGFSKKADGGYVNYQWHNITCNKGFDAVGDSYCQGLPKQ